MCCNGVLSFLHPFLFLEANTLRNCGLNLRTSMYRHVIIYWYRSVNVALKEVRSGSTSIVD